MFTASWKVTGSREARAITQRSCLSLVTRRTEENGRKVVFRDTSEVETESYGELAYCIEEIKSSNHSSWYVPLKYEAD